MAWQRIGTLTVERGDEELGVASLKEAVAALRLEVADLRAARITPSDMTAMMARLVSAEVGAIPKPKDGVDGKDGLSASVGEIAEIVVAEVSRAVESLPRPKDGRDGVSVEPELVEAMVVDQVRRAVDAIPRPKDGRSVGAEDVAPLITGEVAKAVAAVHPAKDGISVTGAVVDRAGHLVFTLSDGAVKDVGSVVGRDADPEDVRRFVVDEVSKIPRPKDGVDGLGFDDLEEDFDGERGWTRRYKQGDRLKEFSWKVPAQIYRGVYVAGKSYELGDTVTWGGGLWSAMQDTAAKPGEPASGWVLSVKSGRDGKPGAKGDTGSQGPQGPKGDVVTKW